MTTDTLYDTDFVRWTERQAQALRAAARAGSNLAVDWENLAEEIESVGRSEEHEVKSHDVQIVSHLLKLALSPAQHPRVEWESEVANARMMLDLRLDASPSLRPRLDTFVRASLKAARAKAARSLMAHGEDEAAAQARALALDISAGEVLDPDVLLPGTVFRREPE